MRPSQIVTDTCAYTNHTILAEALENWPVDYLEKVVPQLMPIIGELDDLATHPHATTPAWPSSMSTAASTWPIWTSTSRLLRQRRGGAAHRDPEEYRAATASIELYPEKFNNKTNGITFRRWLLE